MLFNYKKILLLNIFLLNLNLKASERNLCDDLIDSGTSSESDILRCLHDPRFGKSEYYLEVEEAKKKDKIIAEKARNNPIKIEQNKTESFVSSDNNIEFKKFSTEDLFTAGFGKPFFAIRGDYRNNRYKEKKLTTGDNLCTYLGYEKAAISIVSGELWENKEGKAKIHKQGLVVDKKFWSNTIFNNDLVPEIYEDEESEFTVRKYEEVTCVRRKNKDLSEKAMKLVVEDLIRLPDELSSSPTTHYKKDSPQIDNGKRSPFEKFENQGTEHGYKRPDWMTPTGKSK